jgi:hypothetical protein
MTINAPLSAPKLLMLGKGPTYGTNSNPAATAAIKCFNTTVEAIMAEMLEVEQSDGIHGRINPPVPTQLASTLTTTTYLRGSGTAGTPPPGVDLLFRACGMSVATVASTSVTYSIADLNSALEWVDFKCNYAGQQRLAAGARGTFSITQEAGALGRCEWNLMGLYARPTDVVMPVPTYAAIASPVAVNAANTLTVTLGSTSLCLNAFTYTHNNTYSLFDKAGCVKSVRITDGAPEASLTVLRSALSGFNPYEKMENQTVETMTVVHGTVPGNIVTTSLPKVSITAVADAEIDGLAGYTLTLAIQHDAGTPNHMTMVYT